MTELITSGCAGLLLGATLRGCGLLHRRGRQCAKAVLFALGIGAVLTSFLTWLAVIDVDNMAALPLSAGTLIGGAVFGAAAALTGFSPAAALAGIGGGRFTQSLCFVLGGCVTAALWPLLAPHLTGLHTLFPPVEGTLFRVTLAQPWLLGGGFLSQACLGILFVVAAMFIPREQPEPASKPEAEPAPPPEPESPVLKDHPELEEPPADDEETLLPRQTGDSQLSPSQEAALPPGARVLLKEEETADEEAEENEE